MRDRSSTPKITHCSLVSDQLASVLVRGQREATAQALSCLRLHTPMSSAGGTPCEEVVPPSLSDRVLGPRIWCCGDDGDLLPREEALSQRQSVAVCVVSLSLVPNSLI